MICQICVCPFRMLASHSTEQGAGLGVLGTAEPEAQLAQSIKSTSPAFQSIVSISHGGPQRFPALLMHPGLVSLQSSSDPASAYDYCF